MVTQPENTSHHDQKGPDSPLSSLKSRVSSLSSPPLPHEHGAWVMLYAPIIIALAIARPVAVVPSLLLFLAVTAAFLAREPADLLMRGRGGEGTAAWFGIYTAILALSAAPLFLVYHRAGLIPVGIIAGILFGLHAVLLKWPAKRRMDRSEGGEVIAALGLTLTAPAAYAAVTGRFDGLALCLWAICALYFGSAIFNVKMLLAGAKYKGEFNALTKLRLGKANIAYHGVMAAIVIIPAPRAGSLGGVMVAIAYLPVVLRALWNTATLSKKLPPLKRVGVLETIYALWFTGWLIAGLTVGR